MKFSVRKKILSGYLLLIMIFLLAIGSISLMLTKINDISYSLTPISINLKHFFDINTTIGQLNDDVDYFFEVGPEDARDKINTSLDELNKHISDFANILEKDDKDDLNKSLESIQIIKTNISLVETNNINIVNGSIAINESIAEIYRELDSLKKVYTELHAKYINIFNDNVEKQKSLISFIINNLIYLIIIFITLAILISLFISRVIVKPLLKLQKETYKISEGKYADVNFDRLTNDEIGDLMKAFSNMSDKLKKANEEMEKINIGLEGEIIKRTKDLETSKNSLETKVKSLERMQKITVDRELKMIELKKKLANKK